MVKQMNFLEHETTEGANTVDLEEWTFLKFSERRECFIFKRRAKAKQSKFCPHCNKRYD